MPYGRKREIPSVAIPHNLKYFLANRPLLDGLLILGSRWDSVVVAMVMGSNSVVSATPSFRSSAVVSTSASSSSDGCTSGSSSAGRVDVGRRGFLGGLIAVGVGGINGGGAVGEEMAALEVGLQEGRLRGCDGRPPCVSTSAFQSPSRFMPPWTVSA